MEIYVYKLINSITFHQWRYISDYPTYIKNSSKDLVFYNANFNFCYRDYIYTDIIINIENNHLKSNQNLTYVIVNDNQDYSSWYVLNMEQIRGNQFKLHLKRDILNDYATYLKKTDYNVKRMTPNQLQSWANYSNTLMEHMFLEDTEFSMQNEQKIAQYDIKSEDKYTGTWYFTYWQNEPFSKNSSFAIYGKSCVIDATKGFYLIFFATNIREYLYSNKDEVIVLAERDSYKDDGSVDKKWCYVMNQQACKFQKSWGETIYNEYGAFNLNNLFYGLDCQNADEPTYYVIAIPRVVNNADTTLMVTALKEKLNDYILDIQYTIELPSKEQGFNLSSKWFSQFLSYGYPINDDFGDFEHFGFRKIIPVFNFTNCRKDFSQEISLSNIHNKMNYSTMASYYKMLATKLKGRIVGNDQSSYYDFNILKAQFSAWNEPRVDLEVDYYFRPYNSYRAVGFSGGTMYNKYSLQYQNLFFVDTGNMSINQNTNEFKTYELQNKNYQNIFNRQIQSQDTAQLLSQASSTINNLGKSASSIGYLASGKLDKALNASVESVTGVAQQGLSLLNYMNSRQTQIDVHNMEIENIKGRADKPIINNLFSQSFYDCIKLEVYADLSSLMYEYDQYLITKGFALNLKQVSFQDLLKNTLNLTTYPTNTYVYFEGEIAFENWNEIIFEILNNRVLNEINQEISSGVYITPEFFNFLLTN